MLNMIHQNHIDKRVDEHMKDLGKRIKFLRKQQNRTQDEVAEQCGFTKSLLSKIENGVSTPPVSTLIKIANSLGVNVSDLLDDRQNQSSSFISEQTSNDRANWVSTNKGYSFFAYASNFGNKSMQPYLFEAKKGEVKPHTFSHEGEEFILMLEGTMRYSVGNIQYTLTPGDSIYFNSLEDHMLSPISDTVKYVAVFSQEFKTDDPDD